MKTVIFSHGKESGPYGSKIKYLMEIVEKFNMNAVSLDYRDLMVPEDRALRLIDESQKYNDVILVGSSMGGYASLIASETINPIGLFLLAPAVYIPSYKYQEFNPKFKVGHIVFGYNDEVIPVENGIKLALNTKMPLTLIPSDHRLNADIKYIGEIFKIFLKEINDTY